MIHSHKRLSFDNFDKTKFGRRLIPQAKEGNRKKEKRQQKGEGQELAGRISTKVRLIGPVQAAASRHLPACEHHIYRNIATSPKTGVVLMNRNSVGRRNGLPAKHNVEAQCLMQT
jgi:hypothetical protein